jgi:uncharacterized protein YgbK (DUF1537 family)
MLQSGSKRKRTKQQIADEKAAAEQEKLRIQAKLQQYDMLEQKIQHIEQHHSDALAANSLIGQMMADGTIYKDEHGNF